MILRAFISGWIDGQKGIVRSFTIELCSISKSFLSLSHASTILILIRFVWLYFIEFSICLSNISAGLFFDQNVLCNEHLANETQNSELNLTRSMSIMRYSHCQYPVKSFVIRGERQRQTRMKKRNDILEWDTISK